MKKFNYKTFAKISIIGSAVFSIVIFILFLFKTTDISISYDIDSRIFADYGTVVGGITAALLSLAGILLVLETLKQQDRQHTLQNIESRFFELIKIHRENVIEFESKGKMGRKVIINIYDEFFQLYDKVSKNLEKVEFQNYFEKVGIPARIAYLIVFYGINNKTEEPTLARIRNLLRDNVQNFDDSHYEDLNKNVIAKLKRKQKKVEAENKKVKKSQRKYLPYDGYQSILGHYIRHLFQAVNYINDQKKDLLDYPSKYSYIKTLRAQLSNHEQAILFLNSITYLGEDWELSDNISNPNKKLITKYNFIKNIPKEFTGNINPYFFFPHVFYEYDLEKSPERTKLEKLYI